MSSNTAGQSFSGLEKELAKISEKVTAYQNLSTNLSSIENELANLRESLVDSPSCELEKLKPVVTSSKTKLSELTKFHREVHVPLSKFGKTVEKVFVNNIDHLSSYFDENEDESIVEENDKRFSLVVVDYLLRLGDVETAQTVCKDLEIDESDVDFDRFCKINELISSVDNLKFESARKWLEENSSEVGKVENNLKYSLAKLELLYEAQSNPKEVKKVLQKTKNLVPFSQEFSSDFEHVMGSLSYLGQDISKTPYSDLNLNVKTLAPMEVDGFEPLPAKSLNKKFFKSLQNPSEYLCLDKKFLNSPDVLTRFSQTFRIIASHQAGLSHIDPLFVAFSAGCRVLPKLHLLKLVMASLGKYGPSNASTLPIAVELDPIAIRHNIFHCPVIKEVNDNPIRLNCGHAISKDAFNSLASGERNKVKCPYCPTETPRQQIMHLHF